MAARAGPATMNAVPSPAGSVVPPYWYWLKVMLRPWDVGMLLAYSTPDDSSPTAWVKRRAPGLSGDVKLQPPSDCAAGSAPAVRHGSPLPIGVTGAVVVGAVKLSWNSSCPAT